MLYLLLFFGFRVKSRIDANEIAKDLANVSKSIKKLMPFRVVYVRSLTIEEPKKEVEQARDSLGRFSSNDAQKEKENNTSELEQWTRVYYVNDKGETVRRSEIQDKF